MNYINSKFIIAWCLSVFVGVAVAFGGEGWWLAGQPHITTIHSIAIRNIRNIDWLEVKLISPKSTNCVRQTQHLLYRDRPNDVREYIPLASSLNGRGFYSPETEIEISLILPRGIESDTWNYVNRGLYTCVIWPGLVRESQYETPPTPVFIPEN